MTQTEFIANFCRNNLNLRNAKLGNEYYYQSLPLCIIDAVFSIGIKYQTTQSVVQKYCNFFKLNKIRKNIQDVPIKEEQQTISEFLNLEDKYDFTNKVFDNRNRTSAQNGILKSEAVFLFAKVLNKYGIDYFQDMPKLYSNYLYISEEIMQIPGQRSGISLKYFLMLAGNDNLIKPDRQILSFLKSILNENVSIQDAQALLQQSCEILKKEYPNLNLRLLDHLIWNYQRSI